MNKYLVIIVLIFYGYLPNTSAEEIEEGPREITLADDKVTFVLGNIEFVLLHELAHLLVSDKNIPQLGPPESVADYIAINMAIAGGQSDSSQTFLNQALLSAATAFAVSWESSQKLGRPVPYWDIHALGIQRYYSSICLLYGSAPWKFGALAEFIPERRRANCRAEFEIADKGYQWVVETYGNPQSESDQGETGKEPIEYVYGPVHSRVQDQMMKEIQKLGLIENTVNSVDQFYDLSRPLKVKMERCKQANASWHSIKRELTICYEMLDVFSRVYVMREANREERRKN